MKLFFGRSGNRCGSAALRGARGLSSSAQGSAFAAAGPDAKHLYPSAAAAQPAADGGAAPGRRHRRQADRQAARKAEEAQKAAPQAPEETAPVPAPVPAESAASAELGALSPGGDSSPRQQQVAGHIATVEHRVDELPASNSDAIKKQILQVRQFLKQASDALKTGDAEGAENLATKAGLLLDDIK